jgi:hypothetical protein
MGKSNGGKMNQLQQKAVDLLEAIQLDLINNDISLNAVLVEKVGEYLDDYYAEVSFLNENIHNIIDHKERTYDKFTLVKNEEADWGIIVALSNIENEDNDRSYEARWKIVNDERVIYQPFKEV